MAFSNTAQAESVTTFPGLSLLGYSSPIWFDRYWGGHFLAAPLKPYLLLDYLPMQSETDLKVLTLREWLDLKIRYMFVNKSESLTPAPKTCHNGAGQKACV